MDGSTAETRGGTVKIAIICSRAEAGRDGVGDYSVRLAAGFEACGHNTLVLAERDMMLAASTPTIETRDNIRVVRLPASAADSQRGEWLAAQLDAFAPDWVILQFVCWGLADRGILAPPPTSLLAALSRWRVAIYCHELWLGLDRGATMRHRLWGWRQRRSILRFLALARPALVLTSNPAYCAILERFGWRARILPLHGNIPVSDGAADEARQLIRQRLGRIPWRERREVLLLAVFGSVLPAWNPRPALSWLRTEAERRGQRVLLASIGRPSQVGEALLAGLAIDAGPSLACVALGEAAPRMVSGLLQEADIGLPSTDWLLLGKSGGAAAMQEHGLPILVVRNEQSFRDLPGFSVTHPDSVFRFDPAAPPDYDSLVRARRPAGDPLPSLTRDLVNLLERAH